MTGRLPKEHGCLGTLAQPRPECRGWLKAEHWVMRHGSAGGPTASPRLQEKLDRG